jgi:hypothetical protein
LPEVLSQHQLAASLPVALGVQQPAAVGRNTQARSGESFAAALRPAFTIESPKRFRSLFGSAGNLIDRGALRGCAH